MCVYVYVVGEGGGIYHFFPRSSGSVSPCEMTFEFTIPLRKAINSQINIPHLSFSLSLSHGCAKQLKRQRK